MKKLFAAAGLLAVLWAGGGVQAQEAGQPQVAFDWQRGPGTGAIGQRAAIEIPDEYVFLDAAETRRYVEWTENIPSDEEYLFGPTSDKWEAYFSFYEEGYVKDDESLDADELLASLQESQAASNEERRSRGWSELVLEGWHVPPRYNPDTRTLEWATLLRDSESGNTSINYNTRVLGRKGTMSVQVVARPEDFDAGLAEFKASMDGFAYNAGERYADYMPGDRVAEYGLAALVTGGAVAAAGKKGLFGVIGAFLASAWKLLLAGLVGIGVWLKSRFGKKGGR
ncbi:hypothetical protein N799_09115 [Lysobacter arseniciresistens ZS79]|uniref:Membrane-anchored protein n=1 Tax=Lysobacter arseniciresistens ZS79 TaxID=913325 RepID=A0A0A0EWX0_9GAMM|nr:DUF2167 domain-containing protein [Lysobacter arseniciresistens]KGM54578.1 hypothetical protein N799_09115 [Lysobacter arseniciresistens ZS79]